jgi:hypothetical protein
MSFDFAQKVLIWAGDQRSPFFFVLRKTAVPCPAGRVGAPAPTWAGWNRGAYNVQLASWKILRSMNFVSLSACRAWALKLLLKC